MLAQFGFLDGIVFFTYALLILLSGWWLNRSPVRTSSIDYFKSGTALPIWAVAISVLATAQSAATFLGGPDQGFRSDLSYLATNLSAFIAALLVSSFLLPRFYQANVTTVYQLLEKRFSVTAKQHAGWVYLLGRIFASGARLYMAALAVAMIIFGNIAPSSIIWSLSLISTVAVFYTLSGGISSVIYADVVQCVVYVGAALYVFIFLWQTLDLDISTLYHTLSVPYQDPITQVLTPAKLSLMHFSLDFTGTGVFHFLSLMTGFVLLNVAAFGLDQDMTQRLLTCKSPIAATKALLSSIVLLIPIMLLFIGIGFLLYLFYLRPDVWFNEVAATNIEPHFSGQTVTVFMYYVLSEVPAGLKALVCVGIIAAALSTLNSGLNSMSSVVIEDLLKPHPKFASISAQRWLYISRLCIVLVAVALSLMAALCYYWQQHTDTPLLQFALSVMVFSYSGLLGVFFVALFTNRGSERSVFWALLIGFIVPVLLQPYVFGVNLGFTWVLCIGALVSGLVCALPKPINQCLNQ